MAANKTQSLNFSAKQNNMKHISLMSKECAKNQKKQLDERS